MRPARGTNLRKVLPKAPPGRHAVRYFIQNAPLAIFASSLPGAVNYIAILFLTYTSGFEATGAYRLYFSVFALFGSLAVPETGKIFIRSFAQGDKTGTTALFWNKFAISSLVLAVILSAFLGDRAFAIGIFPPAILGIGALALCIYPCNLYLAKWQAEQRFGIYCAAEFVKYASALALFLLLLSSGYTLATSLLAQLGVIALFHIIFFTLFLRDAIDFRLIGKNARALLHHKAPVQARRFSYAGILPASLEHIDKLLVGWVFGLEVLGIYTLAYSTGRMLYNMLKPGFYIYYRRFVEDMPSRQFLRHIGVLFTIIGLTCGALFWFLISTVPQLQKFQPGAGVTFILFAGYGIAMVRALYGQAYVLNNQSQAVHMLKATTQASAASLILLALALISAPPWALILLALQYPLRDGLTAWLLAHHREKAR